MASRADVEARLRGYAQEYDREFRHTADVERRIIARISITPRQLTRVPGQRPKWMTAGVLVRQLALVCILLLLVGALVVGVSKLRALGPQPTVGVPSKGASVYFSALDFVSANEGWIAETRASGSLAGPTDLYRTTDGGRSWQRQLTWDGPGPEQVRFSANGKDGLVVGRGGVPLFRTADGGASWERMSLPPEAGQVAALLYFLDAREGWVVSYLNDATPGFAAVFHTTDGGGHWIQTARLDVNQQFSYGRIGGSLQGSFMFRDSSTGWFATVQMSGTNIPIVPPYLYATHDGGKTWTVQTLPTQVGIAMDSSSAGVSLPQFVNQRDGVLVVTTISTPPSGLDNAHQAPTIQGTYVYSTNDGGDHWSGPRAISVPGGLPYLHALAVVDASHWFVLSDSGIAQTTDAGRHWQPLAGWLRSNEHISTFQFLDAKTGWAAVVAGTTHPKLAIYRTADGGTSWTRFSAPDVGG